VLQQLLLNSVSLVPFCQVFDVAGGQSCRLSCWVWFLALSSWLWDCKSKAQRRKGDNNLPRGTQMLLATVATVAVAVAAILMGSFAFRLERLDSIKEASFVYRIVSVCMCFCLSCCCCCCCCCCSNAVV